MKRKDRIHSVRANLTAANAEVRYVSERNRQLSGEIKRIAKETEERVLMLEARKIFYLADMIETLAQFVKLAHKLPEKNHDHT